MSNPNQPNQPNQPGYFDWPYNNPDSPEIIRNNAIDTNSKYGYDTPEGRVPSRYVTWQDIRQNPKALFTGALDDFLMESNPRQFAPEMWSDAPTRNMVGRDIIRKQMAQDATQEAAELTAKQAMAGWEPNAWQKGVNVASHLPGKLFSAYQAATPIIDMGNRTLAMGQNPIEAGVRTATDTTAAYIGGNLGRAAGWALGNTILPGAGGAIGSMVGGIAGFSLGNAAGEWLHNTVLGNEDEKDFKNKLNQQIEAQRKNQQTLESMNGQSQSASQYLTQGNPTSSEFQSLGQGHTDLVERQRQMNDFMRKQLESQLNSPIEYQPLM